MAKDKAEFNRELWELAAKEMEYLDFKEPIRIHVDGLKNKKLRAAVVDLLPSITKKDWTNFTYPIMDLFLTDKKALAALEDGVVVDWREKQSMVSEPSKISEPSDAPDPPPVDSPTDVGEAKTGKARKGKQFTRMGKQLTRMDSVASVLREGNLTDIGKIAERANEVYVESGGKDNLTTSVYQTKKAVEVLIAMGYASIEDGDFSITVT